MPVVKITTHYKLYRDLYLAVDDAESERMADVNSEGTRFSEEQKKTINALGSGEFEIRVNEAGIAVLLLK